MTESSENEPAAATASPAEPSPNNAEQANKSWMCVVCGLIYEEAKGWPDDGIEPGTRWEDVPDWWTCPDCGVGKEDFEMIEI